MQSLLMWVMNNGDDNVGRLQTEEFPPESLDREAGMRQQKWHKVMGERLMVSGLGSKAENTYITQTKFFKSHRACQSGPESLQ